MRCRNCGSTTAEAGRSDDGLSLAACSDCPRTATPANKAPDAPDKIWVYADRIEDGFGEILTKEPFPKFDAVCYVPAAKLEEAQREARKLREAQDT